MGDGDYVAVVPVSSELSLAAVPRRTEVSPRRNMGNRRPGKAGPGVSMHLSESRAVLGKPAPGRSPFTLRGESQGCSVLESPHTWQLTSVPPEVKGEGQEATVP